MGAATSVGAAAGVVSGVVSDVDAPSTAAGFRSPSRRLSISAARPAVAEQATPTKSVSFSPISSMRKTPEMKAP